MTNRYFTRNQTLNSAGRVITRMAWSPSGRLLAVPDQSGMLRIVSYPDFVVTDEYTVSHKALWAVAWSPDGNQLAVGGRDNTVHVLDMVRRAEIFTCKDHIDDIHAVTWIDGQNRIISASYDGTLKAWDASSGELIRTVAAHRGRIEDISWSAEAGLAYSAGRDGYIRAWDLDEGTQAAAVSGHHGFVTRILAATSSGVLISASSDGSVRIWDRQQLNQLHIIEGFTGVPHDCSLSNDEKLLAIKDDTRQVRIYRTDTFELIEILEEVADHHHWYGSCRFHPQADTLAVTGNNDQELALWTYDSTFVSQIVAESKATLYSNCKVALVGNTGVGKTALGNALLGNPFEPTESTHGTSVNLLQRQVEVVDSRHRVREVYLWDFAGQPIYRLIQRLDLQNVSAVLLVLDSRNPANPLEEIREWEAIVRTEINHDRLVPRIVTIARVDRGRLGPLADRIDWQKEVEHWISTIETSSKTGANINKLRELLLDAIDWQTLPTITIDTQFQRLRMFIQQIVNSTILEPLPRLYSKYVQHCSRLGVTPPDFAEFRNLLSFLHSEGLVVQLNFGNLILLAPTLLQSYASMMLLAAENSESGDGVICEDDLFPIRLPIPNAERIDDPNKESDLIHAAIYECLEAGVMLRKDAESVLVFPSAVRRAPPAESLEGVDRGATYVLTGLADYIYATVVVTLVNTRLFTAEQFWANAAQFEWGSGGTSWITSRTNGQGTVWIELFHDALVAELNRRIFEELCQLTLIHIHPDVQRLRAGVQCTQCSTRVAEEQARKRLERGFTWLRCNVCDTRLELIEPPEVNVRRQARAIQVESDLAKDQGVRSAQLALKERRERYDVFLSYNHGDEQVALELVEALRDRGIRPWIDLLDAPPGKPWFDAIEQQIESMSSAIVLIGPSGVGPWQREETWFLLQQFFSRRCTVIPVLKGTKQQPDMPLMLQNMQWVDFDRSVPDPMELLVWAITGIRGDGKVEVESN